MAYENVYGYLAGETLWIVRARPAARQWGEEPTWTTLGEWPGTQANYPEALQVYERAAQNKQYSRVLLAKLWRCPHCQQLS